jgi:hypothetical protein
MVPWSCDFLVYQNLLTKQNELGEKWQEYHTICCSIGDNIQAMEYYKRSLMIWTNLKFWNNYTFPTSLHNKHKERPTILDNYSYFAININGLDYLPSIRSKFSKFFTQVQIYKGSTMFMQLMTPWVDHSLLLVETSQVHEQHQDKRRELMYVMNHLYKTSHVSLIKYVELWLVYR